MRKRFFGTVLLLFGALAISATPALAQGRGWGRDKRQENEHADHRDHGRGHREEHARGRGRDHGREHEAYRREGRRRYYRYWRGDRDGAIVSVYFRDHRGDLPPGLARRQYLPPGLQRQLRVNGHLPPGLRGRVVWFPRDLDRRLGPVPYGYRRCWIGGNVMVVNPKTFAILEIVQGISILTH